MRPENHYERPTDYYYTDTHEWVAVCEGVAVVGITDYAVKELTDIVFVDLPEPGDSVQKGDSLGEIESVKTVAELYAPVSGKIVEVNRELPEHLEWLVESPYEKGWMVKIEMTNSEELKELLSKEDYDRIAV